MTIVDAHIMLGINDVESLNASALSYLCFKKNNPDVTYIEWLEQKILIQDRCKKLGLCEENNSNKQKIKTR